MSENQNTMDSPIRGPTLSTSTSSFEALDPHDPNLSKLATTMFRKTEEYVTNELNTTIEEYKLLEDMNKTTTKKYIDMTQIATNLSTSTADLSAKINELTPYFDQIDEIERTVDKLEGAAYQLDAYVTALENKFKTILQKKN